MTDSTQKQASVKRRRNKSCRIIRSMASVILQQIFTLVFLYVEIIKSIVFSFIGGSRRPIPDLELKHNMLSESAVTLAERIRTKELKSEVVVRACIERIKLVNPILNAVTDERYEAALKEAQEVDRMIEAGLSDEEFSKKPFLGVPFTAKESHAVQGMRHTLGVSCRSHLRADADAECVRLLRAAGAIPVAVTNVPEINKWQETRNMLFGQTNNPYHTGRTVGGSSGGEAALSAALASPISLCSDIGGSTRMPAFFCGLFALNPTAGHTSLKGSALRSGLDPTMASIGFVSKHVGDLAPLTRVVAADNAEQLSLDRRVDMKEIKVFYTEESRDWRVGPMSRDMRNAMKKVIKHLSELATSTDLAPAQYYHPGCDHMYALWRHAMSRETEVFARALCNYQGEAMATIEIPKKLLGLSSYTLAAVLKLADDQLMPKANAEWAETLTEELRDDLISKLGTSGVLLFPSSPIPAPHHYALYLRPFNFSYWAIFNALKFPAAQVPLGLNSAGLPVGIQVVAAPNQEGLCLSVAEHLSKTFGGYVPPCKILS